MKMNSQNRLYRTILFFTLLFAASNLFTVSPVNAQSPANKEKQDEKKQSSQDNVELTLNKPIERELAGNESHSYKIVLAADQYLHIVVEQRGIDVVVALFAPDGEKVAEIDSPNGTKGDEPIFFVTETTGNYLLEVRSLEPEVETGRYQAKIEELRISTTQDKQRISARKLSDEAEQLYIIDNVESRLAAIEKYEAALLLFRAINDSNGEAIALSKIGDSYRLIFQFQKALEYFEQGLQIFQNNHNQLNEGRTIRAIGLTYFYSGEYQTAINYLEKALLIFQSLDASEWVTATLSSIGDVYREAGGFDKALDYYNKALAIFQRNNDEVGISGVLINAGLIYWQLNQYQKSIDYYGKALSICKSLSDSGCVAISLVNIGLAYLDLDPQKSIAYFDKALPIFQANIDKNGISTTYSGYGRAYYKLGDQEKALENFNKASLITIPGFAVGDALKRYNIARTELKRGNFKTALDQIEPAIEIIETYRIKAGDYNFRSSFFSIKLFYHELYVDILMHLHKQQPKGGFDVKALQASERARARSLLESLTEANTDIRQGVDPKLLERERELQQLIAGKSERLTRISNDEKLKEQKAAAEKEVSDLLAQYQEVEAQIRAKSPRYAALTQPVPADLAEIQKLLDKDTVLLEYSLGEERSYLWLVTPQSLKSYELPKRARIEELANKFVAGVTGQNNVPKSDNVEYRKRQVFIEKAAADYPQVSAELGKILLGQIAPDIKDKRLLIVGDGILQYVPFAALPFADSKLQIANSKSNAKSGVKYLVETNEIVNLPSASTLAILRREENERGGREYSKTVAVFADPVFDENDKRVAVKTEKTPDKTVATRGQTDDAENVVLRSANDVGLENRGGLKRLIESAREAEAIRDTAANGQTTLALGFDASRERVLTGNFGDYRIVHFATHGFLNEEHPELSGVVLSLINKAGEPQNGFLRLNDIYNLKLPVEMVVLSACQTGLGKNVRGEGLIGLTRGFMYAGAPRVVATLWSVDDFATKELMRIFYQKMLRENLSSAAALRAAQNEIRGQEKWKSPMFWAGFILQGEWQK